ncbi:uncharacterized protein KZ484_019363 [Pholidichthys leucotaenia]
MESRYSSQLYVMKAAMKMASLSTITLSLLLCSVLVSSGSDAGCNEHVTMGKDFSVPMNPKWDQAKYGSFKWIHNDKIIYSSKKKNNQSNVDGNGSLKLTAVNKGNSGIYKLEVHDKDGRAVPEYQKTSFKLCVMDHVKTPIVTSKCLEKNQNVLFTCSVVPNEDVIYEWLQNKEPIPKEKGKTLKRVNKDIKDNTFQCKVSNKVSSAVSSEVQQQCYKPAFPNELFGISIWVFVGGGAGLVLLLILIVIICCIQNRRKRHMRLKDEGEFRLQWTSQEQQNHHHPSHECDPHRQPHHPHHNQHQPAGHTGPRQSHSKQQRPQQCSQQRPQQRPRLPEPPIGQPQPSPRQSAQAPTSVDEEQPPPLPQPRKKGPRAPRE